MTYEAVILHDPEAILKDGFGNPLSIEEGEGYLAAGRGRAISDNPYLRGGKRHEWDTGWTDGALWGEGEAVEFAVAVALMSDNPDLPFPYALHRAVSGWA